MKRIKIIALVATIVPMAACNAERQQEPAEEAAAASGLNETQDTQSAVDAVESIGQDDLAARNNNRRMPPLQGNPAGIDTSDRAAGLPDESDNVGVESPDTADSTIGATGSGTAVTAPGVRTALSSNTVREAQEALSSEGFSVTSDGVVGSETTNAIRQFQIREGLAQTGVLDSATLEALNVTATDTQRAPASTEDLQRAPSSTDVTTPPEPGVDRMDDATDSGMDSTEDDAVGY